MLKNNNNNNNKLTFPLCKIRMLCTFQWEIFLFSINKHIVTYQDNMFTIYLSFILMRALSLLFKENGCCQSRQGLRYLTKTLFKLLHGTQPAEIANRRECLLILRHLIGVAKTPQICNTNNDALPLIGFHWTRLSATLATCFTTNLRCIP